MADDEVTAANLCDRFIEEQEYIQKYIEFVQHKTAMFESQVTEVSNILSKYDLIKIERRSLAWRESYSHEELQQIYDQLKRTIPAIASESEKTASELESLQEPPGLYSIDVRTPEGECIQYMIEALEYKSSPANIEESCRDLMEQIRVHNLEMGDGDPSIYTGDMVEYAAQGAVYILASRKLNELNYVLKQIGDIDIVLRMDTPDAEINVLRQVFITLMTIYDATIFDMMRVALKSDFFALISVFGKSDKVSLEKLGQYSSFEDFRDEVIEDQLKPKYLKDILLILNSLGVPLIKKEGEDKFIHLLELVLRRNIHIHNKGRVDERYLEKDQNGTPRYNIYKLALGDMACIDQGYWNLANRICRNCVVSVSDWIASLLSAAQQDTVADETN